MFFLHTALITSHVSLEIVSPPEVKELMVVDTMDGEHQVTRDKHLGEKNKKGFILNPALCI